MRIIIKILSILWELPQFMIGLVLGMCWSNKITSMNWYGRVLVVKLKDFRSGISLGQVIFVSTLSGDNTIRHELGHSKQSLWLGPLYLLIVGIPSLVHNIIHTLFRRQWDYYSFYTEKWADKISGVNR